MSRPLRIEFEGAWYHVMNRGKAQQRTFPGDSAYTAFLDTLAEASHRFRLAIHAYCLMPNHYHLLVQTPLGNLSRCMRHVDGLYTQRHNRLKRTDGPLFRGRYQAILVDADAYLLSVSRYIHRNPVDARRPLVHQLEDWPWSSYPAYINAVHAPGWLHRNSTYQALGPRTRYRAYQRFVEAGTEPDLTKFYANRRAAPVLGNESFRRRAVAKGSEDPEIPDHDRQSYRQPSEVIEIVASVFGVNRRLLTTRRGSGDSGTRIARQLAMQLCRDHTGLTLQEIGQIFGGIHYSAVTQNIRRLRHALESDSRYRRLSKTVMSRLDP